MRLLVIGAGMMGSAAAYDMARSALVESVTLADMDKRRVRDVAGTVNKLSGGTKVSTIEADAADRRRMAKLMSSHDAALSCVPYFCNLALSEAAVEARCHFADLGGNNSVVRRELELDKKAAKRGVRIAPDCGLSPGLASILAGELLRLIGGKADALKIYVGGLPRDPQPPFHYQLVFLRRGIDQRVLRAGQNSAQQKDRDHRTSDRSRALPPRRLPAYSKPFTPRAAPLPCPRPLPAGSASASKRPCAIPATPAMIRSLYDFGLFSNEPRQVGKVKVRPARTDGRP